MSTILDALKKSEQERKLADLPELSSMPLPEEERDTSKLWWGLAVLALMVIAIIAYLVFSQDQHKPVAEEQTYKPVIVQQQAVQASQSSYVAGSKVYDYHELSGRTKALADRLSINVVSYTEEQARRFVMIDSVLYRIGNTLSLDNGAQLEVLDIESNSVVLGYKKTQFRLSP